MRCTVEVILISVTQENSFPNNCSCLEESTTFSQESNFARNEICRSHRQKEVGSVRKEKSCENISACEKRMNTEANYFIRRKQYLSLEFPKLSTRSQLGFGRNSDASAHFRANCPSADCKAASRGAGRTTSRAGHRVLTKPK